MRILMLSWEYPPRIVGGISRVVHDLAQKIGEMGNDVHVVTCWEQGTPEYEKDGNVHVYRVHTYDINPNNFIDWVMHLNFCMLEEAIKLLHKIGGFDIIHAHDWVVAFSARTLKKSYNIPIITTIHATEHGRNHGLYNETQRYINSVERWLTEESWQIIINSEYMKNEIKTIFNISAEKLHIIPNGVDLNKFKNIEIDFKFRNKFANENEKVVFFVGRLVNEKGVHVLIDAIPKIINSYNDVKFVIAGRGPSLESLQEKAQTNGVAHKVVFTGYISDEELNKLYICADIAVFPSLYEPFGIVALEGMVANIPVVVSDTGGLGEIVNHGIDGMKSYVGNPNSLADSILELLFSPKLVEEIKLNAKEKVKNFYNWDLISRKTLQVYSAVVDEAKKKIGKL